MTFFRDIDKAGFCKSEENTFDEACFSTTVQELERGLNSGHIFSVKCVWDRYYELLSQTETPTPDKTTNILREFRTQLKLACKMGLEFVASARKSDSLLIPPEVSKDTLVHALRNCTDNKDVTETENVLLRTFCTTNYDADLLRTIYHLCSQVKMDLKDSVGHSTYENIDKVNAEAIIPPSLFLLVSMLLGENNDSAHFERILGIAQDIIYTASKGRKLTPKHIGLGCSSCNA